MGKFFKFLFTLILIAIPLVIVAAIGALWFFDPNDYKPQITAFVEKKTGQEIQLGGKISLQLFPWLGLNLQDVSLKNPEGFESPNFATIQTAGVKVETLPLFKGHINVQTLLFKGATVNIERKKNGIENWTLILDDLANEQNDSPFETPTVSETSTPTKNNQNHAQKKKYTFELANIDIKDTTINYVDKKNNQQYRFTKCNLQSSEVRLKEAFPLKGQFELTMQQNGQGEHLSNTTEFSGNIQFKPKTQQITLTPFEANIKLQGPQLPHQAVQAKIKTNLIADMQALTLHFNAIDLQVDNTSATGDVKVHLEPTLKTTFDLHIPKFDLDYYLGAMPKTARKSKTHLAQENEAPSAANQPVVQKVAYKPDASKNTTKNAHTLPTQLQGKLKIDWLKVKNLKAQNVSVQTKSENNSLVFDPIQANLYQGSFNGISRVRFTKPQPTVYLKGAMKNLNLAHLLQDAANVKQLTGTGRADFDITHQAQGLNGSINLHVANGYIDGADIQYYLEQAQALARKSPSSRSNTKRTQFSSLSGSIQANNNVLSNNDLLLEAPEFYAKGKGTVNLNSQTLDYDIIARLKETEENDNRYAIPLAITLTGPIADPKVTPDTDAYVKTILEQQFKKQIDKQLDKQLGKILGTPETTTATDADPTSSSPIEQIEDKIEGELKKGLKKIFKF